jgi:hypothetical protein
MPEKLAVSKRERGSIFLAVCCRFIDGQRGQRSKETLRSKGSKQGFTFGYPEGKLQPRLSRG